MEEQEIKPVQTESESEKKIDPEIQREIDSLRAKNQELLEEKKKVAKAAKEREEEAAKRKEQVLLEKGQYEQLYRSSMDERETLRKQLESLEQERNFQLQKIEAHKIAQQLAEGFNIDILTDYIVKRIQYTKDGFKVLNASGELTVSTLEDLKREFEVSERYKSLRKGSKATGGGAAGSGAGGSGAKQIIDRSTFDSMDPVEQGNYYKRGGLVKD